MAATAKHYAFPRTLNGQVLVGGICWILTIVFFVGQAVAQVASSAPYSLADNEISDLGATTCGPLTVSTYHAYVCSPLHIVMNIAFVAVGVLSIIGAIATRSAWPQRRLTAWGLTFIAIMGIGEIISGLAPEDVNPTLHIVGALLGIPGAIIFLFLLAFAVWRARLWVGVFSLICGLVGLIGFLVMGIAPSIGLGVGVAERLAGYPGAVWTVVIGIFLVWSATRRNITA